MTYSYACNGTPVSNLRSLNQTRVHYNRNGDEKSNREKGESDRDSARDHSSHPFCGRHHLCVASHGIYRASFFLSYLRGPSPLVPCPFGLFALFPFCLSPPSPFDLSPSPCDLSPSPARVPRILGVHLPHVWLGCFFFSFPCILREFSTLSSAGI